MRNVRLYWYIIFNGILEILLVQIQSLFWVSDSKLYNIIKTAVTLTLTSSNAQ